MNWKRLLLLFSVSTFAGVVENCIVVVFVTGRMQISFFQFAVIVGISLASSAMLECLLSRLRLEPPEI
jgi:hypothetical protein